MSINDEPLIYTTKGNLPVASLDHSAEWLEDETCIQLVETFKLDGEIVKQSRHIRLKVGLSALAEQAFM